MVMDLREHNRIKNAVDSGELKAVCHYCKLSPCYELSIQGNSLCKNLLFDENRMICTKCWEFMVNSGGWVTHIIRVLLKINVFLKKRGLKK